MQQEMAAKVDVDELEDLQDQMYEMKQEQDYINEMMNRNYQCNDIDEDDIDEQLRDYEDELFQEVIHISIQLYILNSLFIHFIYLLILIFLFLVT